MGVIYRTAIVECKFRKIDFSVCIEAAINLKQYINITTKSNKGNKIYVGREITERYIRSMDVLWRDESASTALLTVNDV